MARPAITIIQLYNFAASRVNRQSETAIHLHPALLALVTEVRVIFHYNVKSRLPEVIPTVRTRARKKALFPRNTFPLFVSHKYRVYTEEDGNGGRWFRGGSDGIRSHVV